MTVSTEDSRVSVVNVVDGTMVETVLVLLVLDEIAAVASIIRVSRVICVRVKIRGGAVVSEVLVKVSRDMDVLMKVMRLVLARDCLVTNTCWTDTVFSSVTMLTCVSVDVTITMVLVEVDVFVNLRVTGTFAPRLGRGTVISSC